MNKTPTRFQIKRYNGGVETHSHGHHQIVFPLQGVMEMDVEGHADRVTHSCAAVINEGALHCFAASPENAFLIVDFNGDGADADGPDGRNLWNDRLGKPFLSLDPALNQLCAFFSSEIRNGRLQGVQAVIAGDLLLAALEQRLGIEYDPLSHGLAAALSFIEAHCHQDITVGQVAQFAGLSVSHFHALFRKQFGQSPKHYIMRRRLQKAASILEQTDRPLAHIALDMGYGDQSAFSRAFHRHLGQTPARWRKNRRRSEKQPHVS